MRPAEKEPWDDRLAADARHLVALLFVAGKPLPRVEAAHHLRISAARLATACAYLGRALPRLGLALEEHQAELTLVSAGDCAPVVERYLQVPAPEPLSGAALQVLAIVAYEQPVTRADIERIRGIESGAVVDTLLGRGLLAEDRRGSVEVTQCHWSPRPSSCADSGSARWWTCRRRSRLKRHTLANPS